MKRLSFVLQLVWTVAIASGAIGLAMLCVMAPFGVADWAKPVLWGCWVIAAFGASTYCLAVGVAAIRDLWKK